MKLLIIFCLFSFSFLFKVIFFVLSFFWCKDCFVAIAVVISAEKLIVSGIFNHPNSFSLKTTSCAIFHSSKSEEITVEIKIGRKCLFLIVYKGPIHCANVIIKLFGYDDFLFIWDDYFKLTCPLSIK